jgi:hypothetical protein
MANDTPLLPGVKAATFECVCGIRHDECNMYLWIESPRTHERITIGGGHVQELRDLFPRIVKARAEGRRTALFTTAELQRVADLRKRLDDNAKPGPRSLRRPNRGFSRPF